MDNRKHKRMFAYLCLYWVPTALTTRLLPFKLVMKEHSLQNLTSLREMKNLNMLIMWFPAGVFKSDSL